MRNRIIRRAPTGPRRGFTLPELLLVVALASVFIVLLQRTLIGQLRFYDAQRAAADRNESVRFAIAVLGSALREARVPDGDATILTPRSLRVRVPHGIGVVCGTDNNGGRVGLVDVRGRWVVGVADSVIVQRSSGRHVDVIDRIDPPSNRVECLEAAAGLILRMAQDVPDALASVPARSFRSQVFESVTLAGRQWLYRVDGAQRDLIVGPLDSAEGFRVWYEDEWGVEVGAAEARRVVVRVIAQGRDLRGRPSEVRDTLVMRFGGRN